MDTFPSYFLSSILLSKYSFIISFNSGDEFAKKFSIELLFLKYAIRILRISVCSTVKSLVSKITSVLSNNNESILTLNTFANLISTS